MANTIEIIIKARNETGKVFSEIGKGFSDLGDFGVGVLKTGLTAAFATAAAGATALGGALAYAVGEAMEAQAGIAQLEAVLKSTGGIAGVTKDSALDLADSLSQITRFSDDAILAGENMLLTFTNIGADIFPQATETILDMSQALGQDLKSSAIQLGKALNNPIDGITALSRVGVNFTDEQKDMVKAMVEAGDIAQAQAFILHELQLEFGGSARAAGQTFAGQLDILKNSLANVAEEIGTAVLPYLSKIAALVNAKILPIIKTFGKYIAFVVKEGDYLNDFLVDLPPGFKQVAKAIGRVIAFFQELISTGDFRRALGNLIPQDWVDRIYGLSASIRDFIDNTLTPFIQKYAPEIRGAIEGIVAVLAGATLVTALSRISGLIAGLASPIGFIVAIAGLLGAAWKGNWFGIQETVQSVIDKVSPYVENFINSITTWFFENKDAIFFAVSEAWGFVWAKIQEVIDFVSPYVSDFLRNIAQWWAENGDGIIAIVTEKWNAVKDFVGSVFTGVEQFAADFQTNFNAWLIDHETSLGKLSTSWEEAKLSLSGAFESLKDAFSELTSSLAADNPEFAKMQENLKPLIEWLQWAISEVLILAIDDLVGRISTLADIVKIVADGITRSVDGIIETFNELVESANKIVNGFEAIRDGNYGEGIKLIFTGALDGIDAYVQGQIQLVVDLFSGMKDSIVEIIQGLSDELVEHSIIPDMMTAIETVIRASVAIIETIFSGFTTAALKLWDTMFSGMVETATGQTAEIITAVGGLIEQVKGLFISQPWRDIGKTIGEQIAAGIADSTASVAGAVGTVASSATPATGTAAPAPAATPTGGGTTTTGGNTGGAPGGSTPGGGGSTVMNINIGNERLGTFIVDQVNQAVAVG